MLYNQDAFADLPNCLLAHRILSELYRIESDHENLIKVAEAGLELLKRTEASYGKPLLRNVSVLQVTLSFG